MSADLATLDALLDRWRELPHWDRRAVMRHLPPGRQADLARALQRAKMEGRPPMGRYSGCSRWLADLLANCEPDAPPGLLKPLVRDALREGHAQAADTLGTARPGSLLDLIRAGLSERGILR